MADSEGSSGKMTPIPRGQSELGLRLRSDANLFNELCDELLAEILVRLPTTAAVRFQVVCKRWYSLISSPYSIACFLHLRHHTDVQSSLVFQVRYSCDRTCYSGGCKRYHCDFHLISNCSLLREVYGGESVFRLSYLPCSPIDLHNVRLEGSFADLILCSCVNRTNIFKIDYYVSNLLTRQWIALPPAPIEGLVDYVSIGFLCVPPRFSECNPVDDSSHHKFKFMVVRLYSGHHPCSQFKAQVFSSENWLWRTFVVSSPLTLQQHTGYTSLVAYRGMLHWLNVDCIVVYDPLNTPQRFSRIIHLPIQLYRRDYSCFRVIQGCLRLATVSGDDTEDPVLDVWELEDYDSGFWNFVHKVHLTKLIHNGLLQSLKSELRDLFVLSLHPENRDVIYLRLLNGVVSVNMKSRIIERFYPINKRAMLTWVDAFHLADQWWPTQVSLLH